MKTIKNCIYHSRDLDGWTSAAIVREQFPDVKLLGYDYGEDPNSIISQIGEGEWTVMVDVSFPIAKIMELGRKVMWQLTLIDHHISFINEYAEWADKYKDESLPIRTVFDIRQAACELTWEHFCGLPIPEAVRLLGAYDCFRHKGTDESEDVMYFQYWARSVADNPKKASLFLEMGDETIKTALSYGKVIHRYLSVEAESIYKKGIPMDFDGHKFIAFNRERFNVVNFGIDYHKDGYEGAACFWYTGDNKWTFSLYNDNGKVDCSEICKKRGGGGHKGAAGFITSTIKLFQY